MKKNKGTGNREQGTGEVAVERGLINVEAVVQTVAALGQGMKISKDLAELAKDAYDDLGIIRRAATGADRNRTKNEILKKAQDAATSALAFLQRECERRKVPQADYELMRMLVLGRDDKIKPPVVAKEFMFYKGVFHAILGMGFVASFKKDGSVVIEEGGAK